MSPDPTPIIATSSGEPKLLWRADFKAVVTEIAGLGVNVDYGETLGWEATNGVLSYGADRIIRAGGYQSGERHGEIADPVVAHVQRWRR